MQRREQVRIGQRSASPASSPNGVFTAAQINARGHAASPSDPEPDLRNGLSLARNGCASRRLHSGVKAPGLPLQIPPGFVPARSAFWLHGPNRFAPAVAASTPQTRFRISPGRCRPSPPPPLPFGTVTSLRINVFNDSPIDGPACRSRPIPFRSPPPSSFGLPAADHRSGVATFPSFSCDGLTFTLDFTLQHCAASSSRVKSPCPSSTCTVARVV
jgi:hypothetical protein